MIKNITYCSEWNDVLESPTNLLTVKKAEELHNIGKSYCVVIETETKELILVDVNYPLEFHVTFLDKQFRKTLTYDFEKVHSGKLFLWNAWFPQYFGDTKDIKEAEIYYFKENGELRIIKGKPKGKDRYESNSIINVEKNYAEIPSFGNYDSIIMRER